MKWTGITNLEEEFLTLDFSLDFSYMISSWPQLYPVWHKEILSTFELPWLTWAKPSGEGAALRTQEGGLVDAEFMGGCMHCLAAALWKDWISVPCRIHGTGVHALHWLLLFGKGWPSPGCFFQDVSREWQWGVWYRTQVRDWNRFGDGRRPEQHFSSLWKEMQTSPKLLSLLHETGRAGRQRQHLNQPWLTGAISMGRRVLQSHEVGFTPAESVSWQILSDRVSSLLCGPLAQRAKFVPSSLLNPPTFFPQQLSSSFKAEVFCSCFVMKRRRK